MIADFYKNSEVFITGGSGVVGKATIEKLLRSCDVKKIYILLRSKKDYSVEDRLETMKQSKIFRVLRSQKPAELDKLQAIPGDAVLPMLGITPEHIKVLANVSIFFHCAATVRFDESLKAAMNLNVGGTYEALKLAETMKRLKIFMHVSTFYSNPYLHHVEAKLYSSPVDWKFFLELVQDESKQDLLNALTKKIIVGFPNTYCFTKNLAESLVNEYRQRLPVAIYRPSIVIFALREPEPGFPPAMMGAMALFALNGAGLLKVNYVKPDIKLDMTPLDMGTIVMLADAVIYAEQYKAGKVIDIPVGMFSSWKVSPHTFKQMKDCMAENGLWEKHAFEKSLLLPHVYFVSNKMVYKILTFTHQIIPAMIVDGLLKLSGRKPLLTGIARKVISTLKVMEPFLFNNYTSDGITNIDRIREITDGTEFSLEECLRLVDNDEGLFINSNNMIRRIRDVLLNEDESSLPRAKRVLMAKKVVYNLVRAVLAYYLLRWFYNKLVNYLDVLK